MLCKNWK